MLGRHKAGIAEIFNRDITGWTDRKPGDGCMIDTDAQPGLGGELQSSTDKIAYYIAMTYNHCVALLLLFRTRTIEVTAEGGFDAGAITEELLQLIINKHRLLVIVG